MFHASESFAVPPREQTEFAKAVETRRRACASYAARR